MKRGSLLTSAFDGRGQTFHRAWVLLAIAAIVASLLTIAAAHPSSVLGAPGSAATKFAVAIAGPVTAGDDFRVTVTAQDARGRTVPSYPGGASLAGLADAPNGDDPTIPELTVWENGVASAMVTAVKSQRAAQLTASDTIDGVTVTGTVTFDVAPSSAASIAFAHTPNSFNGQPVDAQSRMPIASSLELTYVPVKVIALDSFGNRVGGVSVTISSSPDTTDPSDDLVGTPKTVSTFDDVTKLGLSPYGEAAFSGLSIAKFGKYTLSAAAGSLSATSASFEVVADLAKCTGASCTSTGRSAGANLQITYSSLTGRATFNDVTLTTSFIGAATSAGCTGSGASFGELTEVRVQGGGVTTVRPSFKLAVIMPKETLQVLGLTSRAVDTYNLCLGATRLDDGATGWTGRAAVDGPIVTLPRDSNGVYWGWVANCGTVGVSLDSPCISLKTKNAGQLQAKLGLSKTEFKKLGFDSSDLALVIEKPYPWDGKMGMR
ncbi:MAG TPA: hypothetical protein VK867_00880 [Candidatus Limnocylindrales bacterium]|nr:hypothetical protein [Candidatus Limnocylindrales bacterium]